MLISKEAQLPLVFRLLALHWLLGFVDLISEKDVGKKSLVIEMRSNFYPNVYDALALKSLKLDLLAFCSVIIDSPMSLEGVSGESVVKYFEDGFVCVSGFKWLPPWSTETAVAFRTFYKFLIGASSHSNADPSAGKAVMESAIFRALQSMLVNLLLDFQKLVPVAVALIDRLLSCQQHCCLGEKLLQTVDEHLLSKVIINYRMSSYFLLFDRIGKNDSVPPQRLLELLTKFTIFLVEKHGPDTELKSWHQGSKVLGICRTMLLHHHSSRLFIGLSRLLAFTSLYFPIWRIYLRMLICVPGKKLRNMLNLGDQLKHCILRPSRAGDTTAGEAILVISLPVIGYSVDKNPVVNGIKNGESQMNGKGSDGIRTTEIVVPDNKRIEQPQEPLRVMDSKFQKLHMLGIKIRISCFLRFKSEPFNRVWGLDSSKEDGSELDTLPAMYGIVLKFSSSAPYEFPEERFNDIVPLEVLPVRKPREPVPGLVDISLDANADNGQIIQGKLQGVPVGIEDMFLKTFAQPRSWKTSYLDITRAFLMLCGKHAVPIPTQVGRPIHGTQSVKLLEVPSAFAIRVVERHLAPFVVGVVGGPLVEVVKDGGLIKDTAWIDVSSEENDLVTNPDGGPLYLTYLTNEDDKGRKLTIGKQHGLLSCAGIPTTQVSSSLSDGSF
ncbi:PTS system alpha-glucoside-specific EIICB component [Bienertia sinuspersici]